MAQTKYKLVIEGVNKTKKAFGAVTKSLAKVGGAAKSAAKIVGGIGLVVAAVATAFVALGKKAFDALDSIGKRQAVQDLRQKVSKHYDLEQ